EAIRAGRQALDRSRAAGVGVAVAASLCNLGVREYAAGDLDSAEVRLTEALDRSREYGAVDLEAVVLHNLAHVHRDTGRLDSAAALAEQGLAGGGRTRAALYLRWMAASIAQRRGRGDEAADA